jgi:peptidoglycan/xylan/chitin deacetylase (PgdA/CDA1 family)
MDHDRYPWSALPDRPRVRWPGDARVALVVVPVLQWFPLDMAATPLQPAGALDGPYPDYRGYTHRDYGNRVGIFRVMDVLDRLGLRATAAVNAAVAARYPELIDELGRRRWEIAAHGLHMGQLHHGGLERSEEAAIVDEAIGLLRRASGQPVRGWLSPGGTESPHTLDLLAERGVDYVLDWVNDELPYVLRTETGRLHAMPYAHDVSDAVVIWERRHSATEFAEAVLDHFTLIDREAGEAGGRMLALMVHPWIIGQPHRIGALERVLGEIRGRPGVWPATAGEILAAWTAAPEVHS